MADQTIEVAPNLAAASLRKSRCDRSQVLFLFRDSD
jgi:hypothetical protein